MTLHSELKLKNIVIHNPRFHQCTKIPLIASRTKAWLKSYSPNKTKMITYVHWIWGVRSPTRIKTEVIQKIIAILMLHKKILWLLKFEFVLEMLPQRISLLPFSRALLKPPNFRMPPPPFCQYYFWMAHSPFH